jgi:serine/threonine protein kinase
MRLHHKGGNRENSLFWDLRKFWIMMDLDTTLLDRYHIQRRLAWGGMSEVYLALDEQLQRSVAIKVVNSSDDEHYERFQREIATVKTLTHEHILAIHEYGRYGSWYYYAMPYVNHGTLSNRLAQGPLSLEEVSVIFLQVASALQFAHNHGILHRDIKPSNILLHEDNFAYLADFGLAKKVDHESSITQTGCMIGTPEYMAPELAEKSASQSSDIYALGIVLYQMLTGQLPFKGISPLATFWKHIQEFPTPPSLINPAISQPIEEVVMRALEKNPQHRFPDVSSMAQAFEQALAATNEGQLVSPMHSIVLPEPTQRIVRLSKKSSTYRKINSVFIGLAAVFMLLVIPSVLGFMMYEWNFPVRPTAAIGANVQLIDPDGINTHPVKHPPTTPTTSTTTNSKHTSSTHTTSITYPTPVNLTRYVVHHQSNKGQPHNNNHDRDRGHKGGHGHGPIHRPVPPRAPSRPSAHPHPQKPDLKLLHARTHRGK